MTSPDNYSTRAGFGPTRRGMTGGFVPSRIPYDDAARVFRAVQAGMLALLDARLVRAAPAARQTLEQARAAVAAALPSIIETNTIQSEYQGPAHASRHAYVHVSTGLLNELVTRSEGLPGDSAARVRLSELALGLILGHELAHAAGARRDRDADGEGMRAVQRSALSDGAPVPRAAVELAVGVFSGPTRLRRLHGPFGWLRRLWRYGTPRGRVRAMLRAARDPGG